MFPEQRERWARSTECVLNLSRIRQWTHIKKHIISQFVADFGLNLGSCWPRCIAEPWNVVSITLLCVTTKRHGGAWSSGETRLSQRFPHYQNTEEARQTVTVPLRHLRVGVHWYQGNKVGPDAIVLRKQDFEESLGPRPTHPPSSLSLCSWEYTVWALRLLWRAITLLLLTPHWMGVRRNGAVLWI